MATTPRKTATSRKPRTAARAASRPAVTRRQVEPDLEPDDDVEVTEAEAQEIEAEGQYVTATLCGEDVQIIPPSAWRTSWNRLLQQGDFDAFAVKVFHPDDYELYMELDPTITEFVEFTQDATTRAGERLGNSHGPAPSSRRTRRR